MDSTTRRSITTTLLAGTLAVGCAVGCGGGLPPASAAGHQQPVAQAGYQISTFATGTAAFSHPDSLLVSGSHVFVGYQDVTAKDGTDHKKSTIAEYTLQGRLVRTVTVPGHTDGLRMEPAPHLLLWALSNEDGNPVLTTIDPAAGTTQLHHFPATPHGGGYDDMAFLHGMAFIDASNPTLSKDGINLFPALDTIVLRGTAVMLTAVLKGNATATDALTNQKASINAIDPDSMTINPQGDLVLDNQAGSELLFLHNPGTAHQTIRRLTVGTQVDDTVWATAAQGRLLIADTAANVVYAVRTVFTPGAVYAAAPNDAGVASFVGLLDLKSGGITPIMVGLSSPHGLAFLPDTQG